MEKNQLLQIIGLVLVIAGIGIIFYLHQPDFTQILVLAAVVLIIIGIFTGLGGAVSSVSKPEKGTIIK